jgi:hypothetical protein|tara:strand:- start:277 stop:1779 length:1503 start_codon:yes stop_codon:yes gene_type:complete
MVMKKYEIHDLTRYFHNVRKKDGTLNPILGEDATALTACLSYLLEDTNFVIKAYSGTGKTVIMEAIFGLLPEEFYHTMEHLSETAVWYEMDKINRSRFVAIPEAQKLPEPVMEVIKTWGDGRAAQRKRTDITIKETVTQTLNPKYVFMCVAVENDKGSSYFDAELERRCMIMHTNPTVAQTERVVKHKLLDAAVPKSTICTMSDKEIDGLQKHILDAVVRRDSEEAIHLKNPCAPFLFEAIPSAFPVSRSKVQYLLRLINAVARFYPDEILRVSKDGVRYGLVTPKHNWLGLRIYLNSFVEECLHMPSHGTDILKLFPDTRLDRFGFADGDTIRMSTNEIKKAAKAVGLPFTKLDPILMGLVMTGFLEMDDDKGKRMYYKSPLIDEPVAKINWSDLIEETKKFVRTNWPEVASEYIGRSCGCIQLVDPFSGDDIELGERATSAKEVEVRAPKPFKTHKDYVFVERYKGKDIEGDFLLKAEGDYDSKEIEEIVRRWSSKKS